MLFFKLKAISFAQQRATTKIQLNLAALNERIEMSHRPTNNFSFWIEYLLTLCMTIVNKWPTSSVSLAKNGR